MAALLAAASCRRRLRFRVPAFSRSRRCRVLVGAAARPLVGLALALRRSRSSSCSPRCWLPAVLPGFWKQRLIGPSTCASTSWSGWLWRLILTITSWCFSGRASEADPEDYMLVISGRAFEADPENCESEISGRETDSVCYVLVKSSLVFADDDKNEILGSGSTKDCLKESPPKFTSLCEEKTATFEFQAHTLFDLFAQIVCATWPFRLHCRYRF